jgi:hypothetical protein
METSVKPFAAAFALALAAVLPGPAGEPSLKDVMKRAAVYVHDYHAQWVAIVGEERYLQHVEPVNTFNMRVGAVAEQTRVMTSDFVIVRGFAGETSWFALRDVIEVDGARVNGTRARIEALLDDTSGSRAGRARALADQQAQYNLGEIYRTVNVPTLPLEFLLPERQDRFRFKRTGIETIDGRRVWRVSFDERERPTMIRTPDGKDMVSRGVFWIDPETGAVLKTEHHPGENMGRRLRTTIVVTYTYHDKFQMLLPATMKESYVLPRSRIEAEASYSNFRRFEAESRIKKPR